MIHVATVEDGTLYLDGEPELEHPYRRERRGLTYYYPAGTDYLTIEAYAAAQDSAYVGAGRGAASYTFRGEGGHHQCQIVPAETWGVVERDPVAMATRLTELQEAVEAEEWKWARTVGCLAGRVCAEHSTEMEQLPPRWRTLAHAAIHQGPTVCLRGGAPDAVTWDRQAAFLRALFQGFPIRKSWRPLAPGAAWRRYHGKAGIVRALVRVPEARYAGHLPPLPVRSCGATVYPVGWVRGVWTIALLSDAVEHGGCEVEHVDEAIHCRTEPIHAFAGERIQAVADPALRKLLYTRYWGRLAATGGWLGTLMRPEKAPKGKVYRFPGSVLFWVWSGADADSYSFAPDYRPDHAAWVASENHLRMNETIRSLPRDALVGAHVDAVWVDAAVAPGWRPGGPDFREKGRGPLRFYGVGTYAHEHRTRDGATRTKLAAQGYDWPQPLDTETMAAWGAQLRAPPHVRRWLLGEDPGTDAGAYSDPPRWIIEGTEARGPESEDLTISRLWRRGSTPSIYDPHWTTTGWVKPAETTEDNEVTDAP